MNKTTNILFSGIGGQGIILASDITSLAVMRSGLDVKKSEIHGMAQRGGSVVAHLRFGEKVYSPVIEFGTTDIQVSFEMMESLRYIPFMKKEGMIIVNTQKIPPLSVTAGSEHYPSDIIDNLVQRGLAVHTLDALTAAGSLGEIRTINMIMIGALSCYLPVDEHIFEEIIRERVKKQFVDVNLEAFRRGRIMVIRKNADTCTTE